MNKKKKREKNQNWDFARLLFASRLSIFLTRSLERIIWLLRKPESPLASNHFRSSKIPWIWRPQESNKCVWAADLRPLRVTRKVPDDPPDRAIHLQHLAVQVGDDGRHAVRRVNDRYCARVGVAIVTSARGRARVGVASVQKGSGFCAVGREVFIFRNKNWNIRHLYL
jgi:hypothetical protein